MKIQLPFHNHATGRSAGTIFQTYWGHTYARSMPVLFHYPDTKLQQETQAKFFAIDKQYINIYRELTKAFPQSLHFNRNAYNTLAKGIFRVAQTYPNQQARSVPKWFGTDTQQQIRLSFSDVKYNVTVNDIQLYFCAQYKLWRRHFVPSFVPILLINKTKQQLVFVVLPWQTSPFELSYHNKMSWLPSDVVRVYASLLSPNFMSNFYRVVS